MRKWKKKLCFFCLFSFISAQICVVGVYFYINRKPANELNSFTTIQRILRMFSSENYETLDDEQLKYVVAVVSNHRMFERANKTIRQLRDFGKWDGDLVFFHDNTITEEDLKVLSKYNVIPKLFENLNVRVGASRSRKEGRKYFKSYYLKFQIFNMYWKKWDRVMYFDGGTSIMNPIQEIFDDVNVTGHVYARSAGYPKYERSFYNQLDRSFEHKKFLELEKKFGKCLRKDYINSGFLYFDTNLIYPSLVDELVELQRNYSHCIDLDQCYFGILIECIWKNWIPQITTRGYSRHIDFTERGRPRRNASAYIALKYCSTCKELGYE